MDATGLALTAETLEALIEQTVATAAERIYTANQGGLPVSRAWTYKRPEQVREMGEARAPWYVAWIDPDGKRCTRSCGPGTDGRRNAQKLRRKVEAELLTGTYRQQVGRLWCEFRQEYDTKIVPGLAPRTQDAVFHALNRFE